MTNTRRVTGSSNVPITPEGEAQARAMVEKLSHPFDVVYSGPEIRMIQTALYFGRPIILKALDAWRRARYEGMPAHAVKMQMQQLIIHPNRRPPGRSPISGKSGETHDEFIAPLIHILRVMDQHDKPEERSLLVMSGGGLQVVDAYRRAGSPAKLADFNRKPMAKQDYWTATGQLFKDTPKGLQRVSDNTAPGRYMIEHAATEFNKPGEDGAALKTTPK